MISALVAPASWRLATEIVPGIPAFEPPIVVAYSVAGVPPGMTLAAFCVEFAPSSNGQYPTLDAEPN